MTTWKKQATEAARHLLDERWNGELPVDVEAIASTLSIPVERRRLEPRTSGMFVRKGRRSAILINKADPPVRQRFTIAHELGHARLHDDGDRVFLELKRNEISSMAVREEEMQANAFAAELLMPAEPLRSKVLAYLAEVGAKHLDPHDDCAFVSSIAGEFDVSAQAMGIRLQSLRLLLAP